MTRSIDLKQASRLVVVSGIPIGYSGTGRFLAHLQERMSDLSGNRIKLVARPEAPDPWQLNLWWQDKLYFRALKAKLLYRLLLARFWIEIFVVWLMRNQRMILLHPQNLGYRLALKLIESREDPALIYLLDSSFFCLVSYNHIKGENGSCIKCIEHGFNQIEKNGCKPFPHPFWTALEYAPRLQQLVKAGRVNVAAQNIRQAELAQRLFDLADLPQVIGLWTKDWDEIFLEKKWHSSQNLKSEYRWDVLFHGHCLDAKGASWTARLAERCADLQFMFPFPKPDWFVASPNCSFVPCTWESGLQDEMEQSRFVIVPSLWSAPIEGALVKSIACAEAVIVVNNPNSFSDEIPDGVVLKLSSSSAISAEELIHACKTGWRPNAAAKAKWLAEFANYKIEFVPKLVEIALANRNEGV